jgi:hypothetical protein
MSILHFSGKFKYQPPKYNNEPGNPERFFDASLTPDDVHGNITEGVEPLQYFEFEFYDVFVRKVTYDDGTSVTDEKDDPVICKKIQLKGLLVDTAPHLERGRLYAGEIRVLDLLIGRLELAVQSDLFRTIVNDEIAGVQSLSADFEANINDLTILQNIFVTSKSSRYLREFDNGEAKLKIYFHVSQFSFKTLQGTIFGYIGPQIPVESSNGIRISKRRVLITPNIDTELIKDLGIENHDTESEDVFRNDLEGTFEILEKDRIILLQFLNFIPFTDLSYSIPKGYRFFTVLLYDGQKIDGIPSREIYLDSNSISKSGGVQVLPLPVNVKAFDKLKLNIVCTKNDSQEKIFVEEPEFDLRLHNEQRFLVLSSDEKKKLIFKIYQNNKILKDISEVELSVGRYEHGFSPLVSWISDKGYFEGGTYVCSVQARNLENSEIVGDPIYGVIPNSTTHELRVKISGELPWDRYYGNYIFIRMETREKMIIKQNIPVRVLHSVPLDKIQTFVNNLDKEKIQEVVTKLISYYVRYYPWLHVSYIYVNTEYGPKKAYQQFLKIREFLTFVSDEDLNEWHMVHESVSKINHLLERLERDEHDWKKTPRSRDFPSNGIEFLKIWKAVMVDKLVEQVKNQKNQILESEKLQLSEVEMDLTDIGGLQNIMNQISVGLENLPDGYKRLFLRWKFQILDLVIKELNELKTRTKHSHTH